jgi:hypothetical protein
MGYGNTHNTILLPDEEEQLVREELGRLANNANTRRDDHGTTSPCGDRYAFIKKQIVYF